MKLITKAVEKKAIEQYPMGSDMEQMVVAKYFHPFSSWTWYLMNMEDKNGTYCWGIVDGNAVEVGSFSMSELKEIYIHGLGIERDRHFEPIKANKLWKELNK